MGELKERKRNGRVSSNPRTSGKCCQACMGALCRNQAIPTFPKLKKGGLLSQFSACE